MKDFLAILGFAFAFGAGFALALMIYDYWHSDPIPTRPESPCQQCGQQYHPDESAACLPEIYCGEACEVAALEKMAA